jgi:hypothetical protein
MKLKRGIIGPLVAAAAAGAAVVALVSPASAVLPADAVALLASRPAPGDPPMPYSESFRLDPSTVRFAGSTATQQFWVAVDVDGKVCIITVAGTPETGGAACAPPAVVRTSGVMVGLTPDAHSGVPEYVVYLLPDTVSGADVRGPWQAVGGNVVVVADAAAARASDTVSLSATDGTAIALIP